MKRKLVRQGGSALTVTLPVQWARQHGLQPGSEVSLESQGSRLVIDAHDAGARDRITIDISGLDHALAIDRIVMAYKLGYGRIDILFSSPTIPDAKTGKRVDAVGVVQNIASELVGVEVVEQKEGSCVIVDLSAPAGGEFDAIIRRIFLLVLSFGEESLKAVREGDKALMRQTQYTHKTIRKLATFCIRHLNEHGHAGYRQTYPHILLLLGLQEMSTVYRFLTKEFLEGKVALSDEASEVYGQVNCLVRAFYESFYSYGPEKASALVERRAAILQRMNRLAKTLRKEEFVPLTRLAVILNKLHELQEATTAINTLGGDARGGGW